MTSLPGASLKALSLSSCFDLISRPENHPNHDEAYQHKEKGHGEADAHTHIRDLVEAPAKSTHEIHHRVKEGDLLPKRREHFDGIEASPQKGKGSDDESRNDLKLLETICPHTDDETKK